MDPKITFVGNRALVTKNQHHMRRKQQRKRRATLPSRASVPGSISDMIYE